MNLDVCGQLCRFMISPTGLSGASCSLLSEGFIFREKLSILGDSKLRSLPSPCRALFGRFRVGCSKRKNRVKHAKSLDPKVHSRFLFCSMQNKKRVGETNVARLARR